jgi:hypothetical protein
MKKPMSKHISQFYLFLILAYVLAGCRLAPPSMQPNQIEHIQTLTILSPTSTLIPTPAPSRTMVPLATVEILPSPTLTPTIKPLNTLEHQKANETIKILLQKPVDCSAPCFWGIVPEQTTNEEAKNIFRYLGLQMASKISESEGFSSIHYILESGLSIRVILNIQNNIVENMQIKITPGKLNVGIPIDWLAYSPETLINRYGVPSQVDFIADWGPGPFFAMQMYFDAVNLIIQYAGENIIPSQKGSSQVCPLTAQYSSVWLWMGKNPVNPPGQGIPLENVASLTLDEFSHLMIGDPNLACFIFDGNAIK